MTDTNPDLPESGTLATTITDTPPVNDTWTVRIVTLLLGLVAALVVAGAVVLAALERSPLPGEITTIGAGAAGALGAMLASTASRRT